ncbi:uncharacterized protein B0I36DRAFT_101876 [Microdochium trichocladiopsis]|uniref:RING-type E3 ubiquitin transferase n=1 Tax=Microdochium trichocladiopsis TaxID=1682393 RepID=A0A9P8Y8S8_9PEZI|nr:uncharacterized protein B0I36DRAFT_101876 [Microdochium trichocladiopsis]KAH7032885.1 hypothetical protein B0I36DRAFT_101876 [Microdochium trichocladiopsis]
MRLMWYTGASAALATGVVAYAFNQRANFYSAMVYLSQNNLSLMVLINLILLVYGSFVWGLQRLCYGRLRPIEIEQLYEKAWFAVTETCLAMTIFREEIGAWFLVMFTSLVTGKVWEWIGEGRVEVLEQQPPTNPRLFHIRLCTSLAISIVYDLWLLRYTVNSVIQQAKPTMMVMFLFEFAILTTCTCRTGSRYILSLVEASIVKKQTKERLEARRCEVKEQRIDILRRRESDDPTVAEAAAQEELLNEDDIDEMDIEVPGWENKGQWVLALDLFADFVKLGVYSAFFAILMMFYGLPIHIMRDLFMTARSFIKRLGALIKYRKALQDMNKYPDATAEDLQREDTCIICREEMHPWDPAGGAVERSRPKKLPCGHILHLGCLKGWLERQQVCPTCRRSVVIDGQPPNGRAVAAPNNNNGPAANNAGANAPQAARPAGRDNMRVFQFGPLRLGFAQGNPRDLNIQDMAQRMAMPQNAANAPPTPAAGAVPVQTPAITIPGHESAQSLAGSLTDVQAQLNTISQRLQQEVQSLQHTQAELQTLYALTSELARLQEVRRISQQPGTSSQAGIAITNPAAFQMSQQLPLPNAFPPTFASAPPHLGMSSIVSRHGGASYSAAIPAGSPELPEGVVIPAGWSLLPLQRLDGQAAAGSSQDAQHGVGPVDTPTTMNSSAIFPSHLQQRLVAEGAGMPRSRDASPTPGHSGVSRQAEPPVVAAPTPLVPNWGGAAQLFANNGGRFAQPPSRSPSRSASERVPESHIAPAPVSHPVPPVPATAPAPQSESESEEDSDEERDQAGSGRESTKGAAKPVTVEDAEDDSDDE